MSDLELDGCGLHGLRLFGVIGSGGVAAIAPIADGVMFARTRL